MNEYDRTDSRKCDRLTQRQTEEETEPTSVSSVPGVEASREPHQMITVLPPQGVDKVQVGAISTQHQILNVPHPLSNSACSDKYTGDTQ